MTQTCPTGISLYRRIDASRVAQYLVHLLGCDGWFVVCQRDHQLVIHLSRQGLDRYAVVFECTPSVDKAIYHGSWTSHFKIVPLEGESELSMGLIGQIKSELAHW